MRAPLSIALLALAALLAPSPARAWQDPDWDKDYVLESTSTARSAGVEPGSTRMLVHKSSGVFPGTVRRVWIHLPAESILKKVGDEGLAVMVFQDGHAYVDEQGQFRAPIVLDNLVHAGKIPPLAAIFIDPGHEGADVPGEKPGWQPAANNRSLEYDTLSPEYAKFLEESILPLAESDERLKAAGVRLTTDPAMRGICGISSGGICAFTVAFERPDLFRIVLSHVGSFADIRGGDHYPSLVRRTKDSPKPIRVFLQAGEHDLDNWHGHWWLSNLQMEKALAFAGYDHKLVGGIGGHNGKHGGAILPESLEWLWRGWNGAE
jgi:enterochelin esterase family protein